MSEIKLPAVVATMSPTLDALTEALGVPRDVLASEEEIQAAWHNLPRVLTKIPPELRTEGLARMCVAVASGLFDSAVNYIWNTAIIELRNKIRRFGLNVVQQVIGKKDFDENGLLDLKDAELLEFCLKLNLITEDGFFLLDQCRDIRNNFSAAHPTIGKLDDHEFVSFVNRCAKYALGNEKDLVGVDIQAFVNAVKGAKFSVEQRDAWATRLQNTHEAQRELLFGTLHGLFCDPASSEEARLNALIISRKFVDSFTPRTRSELIGRHQDYLARGDKDRHKASQLFFEKLKLLALLDGSERHALILSACKNLFSVHQGLDNFYNEPPFAERLKELASQGVIPDTVRNEFVETVITCAVGNPYGVSHAAHPAYIRMVKGFSPAEVVVMLGLPTTKSVVGSRIKSHQRCRDSFKLIVRLVDFATVPTKVKAIYSEWVK
jgi:hypothetical protein